MITFETLFYEAPTVGKIRLESWCGGERTTYFEGDYLKLDYNDLPQEVWSRKVSAIHSENNTLVVEIEN